MPTRPRMRDPRSIITPDAFEVSPDLLGTPLAPPMKRLVAICIDLAVVGLITAVTKSVPLLLGVVAAVLFIRAGIKRTPVRGSVFNRAMRLSVGCLGLVIAAITIAVAGSLGLVRHAQKQPSNVQARLEANGIETNVGIAAMLSGLGAVRDLRRARTDSEAEAAIRTLVRRGEDVGMSPSDLRDLVTQAGSRSGPGRVNVDSILDVVLAKPAGAKGGTAASAALAAHLRDSVVADTLRHLQERVADLEAVNQEREQQLKEARAQMEKAASGGFFQRLGNWLSGALNMLGFGFGWAAVYMTVFTSWWKGQTVGKRLMGIRVLRLDGEPMTWWSAFDRQGGYAAGFATGLLGFAQVFWDANRQMIQDRISGTVVVLDGAEKVGNWEEAL